MFHLFRNIPTSSTSSNIPAPVTSTSSAPPSTTLMAFTDYSNCPQHRSLLLNLCSIIQAVTISCPSALVWHNLGDGKSSSPLVGSPLDLLPCSPSSLPMPFGKENEMVENAILYTFFCFVHSIVFCAGTRRIAYSSSCCTTGASQDVIKKNFMFYNEFIKQLSVIYLEELDLS